MSPAQERAHTVRDAVAQISLATSGDSTVEKKGAICNRFSRMRIACCSSEQCQNDGSSELAYMPDCIAAVTVRDCDDPRVNHIGRAADLRLRSTSKRTALPLTFLPPLARSDWHVPQNR